MRKKALLIGNSNYQYPGIDPLTAPKEDILKLKDVLLDPAMGGFDTVISKFDLDTQSAKREISKLFKNASRDDLIVFYYAGHGIRDAQGQLFLATHDTDKSLIDASALEASYLLGKLKQSSSQKKVVILDCCHAGAVIDNDGLFLARDVVDDALIKDNFVPQGEGTYVLAACKAGESAFESKEGKYSIYTRTLIEAITTGNAAPEKDVLTINDIHEYIRDERLYNRDTETPNPHTEPLMIAAQADSLEISLNPNVRRPLNTGLMEALTDENYLTRIGAVSALKEVIDGEDSYQAESAIKALEERLPNEFDRRVEKNIKAVLSVERKIEPVKSPAPSVVSIASEEEESTSKLLLRFLKNWPTWEFTVTRIKTWGGEQDGFKGLRGLAPAELLTSLDGLLKDGKIRERISEKGNRLFQYASSATAIGVIVMEDGSSIEKVQNFFGKYKKPIAAIGISIGLSIAVVAYNKSWPAKLEGTVGVQAQPYYCDVKVTTTPITKTFTKEVLVKEAEPYYQITPAVIDWSEQAVIVQEAGLEGSTYKTVIETIAVLGPVIEYVSSPAKMGSQMKPVSFGTYAGKSFGDEYLFQKVLKDPTIEKRVVPRVTKQVSKRVIDKKGSGSRRIPAVTRQYKKGIVKTPATYQKLLIGAETKTLSRTFEVKSGRSIIQAGICDFQTSETLVKDIQMKLSMARDGDWGSGTQKALIDYQTKKELSSGDLTLETLESLGINVKRYNISTTKP